MVLKIQKKLGPAKKAQFLANMRKAMSSAPVQDAILRHLAYDSSAPRTSNYVNARARASFKTALGWRPPVAIQRAYQGHQRWLKSRKGRIGVQGRRPSYRGRYSNKSWRRRPY